jgi:hypothetical protein
MRATAKKGRIVASLHLLRAMTPDSLRAEHFEALLRRLGPDRELAGVRYEQLRRRLIVVFSYRGCRNPEDLADQTMDRVARKLREDLPDQEATDLSPFVFGVAWNIARESFRRMRLDTLADSDELPESLTAADRTSVDERREWCLERCLQRLGREDRDLVLSYFQDERGAKIRRRALLARQLRITSNALRLRIWRLTASLRACGVTCLETGTVPNWEPGTVHHERH